ncbi:MAG: glycosyltransferase family 39 protein [Planctomycetes bacterium]|nr:glycosyltransferase family 39 protein [Planctomycetota bacterium]
MGNVANFVRRLMTKLKLQPAADQTRYRVVVWEACVVLVLLAVVAAVGRGPWDPDELKYAQVVKGMKVTGDLFVPHLWGDVYPDKPPLYFWLVLGFAPFFTGVGLPALLAPVVLAACLGLWLVAHIASRWYGEQAGMLAAVVLVSLPLYLITAQIGRMDMLLCLFITAAVYCMYVGYIENCDRAKVLTFVLMGLGVLAKGPLGIIFPFAIGGAFLAATGNLRKLWCPASGVGVLVLTAVLAIWMVPAVASEGPGYLGQLLGEHSLQYAVSGLDHPEPPYFYLYILPVLLLPWVIFLKPAVSTAWSGWREQHNPRELFLLCWAVVPLVILSLVRAKLPVYLLPAMPPIAILVGRYWNELLTERAGYDRLQWRVAALSAFAGVGGLAVVAAGLLVNWKEFEPHVIASGGTLLVVIGLVGWMINRWGSTHRAYNVFWALAAVAPCGALYLALIFLPPLDASQSWRAVADSLAAARSPAEPVVVYRLRPFLGYFVNQEVACFERPKHLPQLAALVHKHGSVWCAVRTEDLDALQRYCLVDCQSGGAQPSPKGPVQVVRLRPLDVAEHARRGKG